MGRRKWKAGRRAPVGGVIILLLVMAVIAASCSRAAHAPSAGQPRQPGESGTHHLTLVLDRYPNAMHAFIFAAIDEGYLREQGISLTVLSAADQDDPLNMLISGRADAALTSQPRIVIARAEHKPVQSIAAIVPVPLNYLLLPQDSAAHTPKHLEQLNVGYTGRVSKAIVQTMLQTDKADPEQVQLLPTSRSQISGLRSGRIDALIGGWVNLERLTFQAEGFRVRTISPQLYGVPSYYEAVLAVDQHKLEKQPEVYGKLWRALADAQRHIEDNPELALDYVRRHEHPAHPVVDDIERENLQLVLPLMSGSGEPFGAQTRSSWKKVADWLEDAGTIQGTVEINDLFVNLEE